MKSTGCLTLDEDDSGLINTRTWIHTETWPRGDGVGWGGTWGCSELVNNRCSWGSLRLTHRVDVSGSERQEKWKDGLINHTRLKDALLSFWGLFFLKLLLFLFYFYFFNWTWNAFHACLSKTLAMEKVIWNNTRLKLLENVLNTGSKLTNTKSPKNLFPLETEMYQHLFEWLILCLLWTILLWLRLTSQMNSSRSNWFPDKETDAVWKWHHENIDALWRL